MSIFADKIIISVIVCTHNRPLLLRNCLESLANQQLTNELFEVIVVDNCSTDATNAVVQEFISGHKNFRGFKENHLGLSHARNRGWQEAYGHYIAYIDDDAIAYPSWMSGIIDFIKRQPGAGIFGGPYDAFYLATVPDWFPPEYGKLDLGEHERCIKLGSEWISGSNMVIKKGLFFLYGGFDVRLGMTGETSAYGEEVNLFLSMHDKGEKIFYVPSIRVAHLVAEYKMSLSWLLRSGYSVGRRYELTFNVSRSLLSHIASFVNELGVAFFKMLCAVNIPFKRRLYYSFYNLCYEAGAAVEHVSTYLQVKNHDV